uniref:Uncharacterized protein n=1 Tax=Tanacetum cinerariifolium TaxID=118510 RepID=A0A699H9G0_TANCI|nr:hypothetical protein [Tanacetum cinerariifolium]
MIKWDINWTRSCVDVVAFSCDLSLLCSQLLEKCLVKPFLFIFTALEITDTSKADVRKTEEVKDDNKKAKLPPSSFSLFVSSGFGNQFLNLSFDISIVGNLKDTADVEINSLLDVQIQQEIPHIQSPSILIAPVSVIPKPMVLSPIPEIPTETSATTLPPPLSATSIILVLQQRSTPIPTPPITTVALVVTTIPDLLPIIIQRVSVLEKDIQELKDVDHTTTLLASLRSKIQLAVNAYLGSDVIKESVQANFINEVKNLLPKFLPRAVSDFATLVIQSTVKKALEKTPIVSAQSSSQAQSSLKAVESLSEYELKTILYENMDKSRSYLTHDKHQALFYALLNSMCLDNFVARGQANPKKILRKRDHDDDNKDEDPSARPDQDKKTKNVEPKKEPVEEPAFEMASDDIEQTVDDLVNDAERPQEDATQTKDKALNKD